MMTLQQFAQHPSVLAILAPDMYGTVPPVIDYAVANQLVTPYNIIVATWAAPTDTIVVMPDVNLLVGRKTIAGTLRKGLVSTIYQLMKYPEIIAFAYSAAVNSRETSVFNTTSMTLAASYAGRIIPVANTLLPTAEEFIAQYDAQL